MGLLSVNAAENYLLISNLFSFVFCIFIVAFMGTMLANKNNSLSRFIFRKLMSVVIACLVADALTYILDTRVFFGAEFLNHLTMFASVIITVFLGSVWNVFFDAVFHIQRERRAVGSIYNIPVAVAFVCLFVNLFTGFLFSFGENNTYERGPYAIISFILQYFLFGVLILRTVFLKFEIKTLKGKKLRISFICAGLLSLFFGLFQIIALGKVALHCYGVTASVFIMFLRFQEDQITNDILTGLNNRYAIDTYIHERIKSYSEGTHGGRQLYLIMLDVNHFKRINDKYGHVEGDYALKTVAQTLKTVAMKYGHDLFIGRYGGDEFTALYECNSEKKVKELCLEIKTTLKNITEDNKYLLTIGTGYACYTGKEMKLALLYDLADKALYADKDAMKNAETHIIV